MRDGGMAVTIGQLEVEEAEANATATELGSVRFTALAHNAILGAAGGAVLATELAVKEGYVFRRVKAGLAAV